MFKVAREGYPFILSSAIVVLITAVLEIYWMAILFSILTFFILFFFRDPERQVIQKKGVFYSPADGKVIFFGKTVEDEILKDQALEVSIFMSPFDVHINRIPCDGIVREIRYYPGRFYAAFKEDSSRANEHITMLIEGEDGSVVVRQVAGFLARRAVCNVKPGDIVKQGQRYGLIKFSSRVDIYLPLNANIRVKLKDKVKAGQTIIGTIQRK